MAPLLAAGWAAGCVALCAVVGPEGVRRVMA
jgi:hypothetical protein